LSSFNSQKFWPNYESKKDIQARERKKERREREKEWNSKFDEWDCKVSINKVDFSLKEMIRKLWVA